MIYKKYLLSVISITIFFIVVFVTANYIVDPYGVFKHVFDNQRIEPNQHFIKMKYVLNNQANYDSFIFGSSRVGNIDVSKISSDEHFYNMTYSEGLPKEFLDDIKLMIARGVKIKTILIGLDEFSFRVDPKEHSQQPMRKSYPINMEKILHELFIYGT